MQTCARLALFLVTALTLARPAALRAQEAAPKPSAATNNFSWPLQVEMRIPFAPTAFPSGQTNYLFYELYLTNFTKHPLALVRIEVLNADDEKAPPIAIFDAAQLQTMLQPTGRDVPAPARTSLDSGESAIVFMEVQSPRKASLPSRIAHRVVTEDAAVQGAVAETRHTHLNLLAAPLHGENWLAADGPSNSEENHHRRGTILLDGNSVDSRRFAIDWKRVKGGVSYSGDKHDVHSYYSYAQPVFAVADGRVQTAREGMPDNVPGHGADFHSAVPLNLENVSGNTITLDLGDGQFAYYMHLQPGTLRVKAGDLVKKGQLLAAIGASGDAREPHLHFEVTTSPKLLRGEGVPYVLEHYRINADTNNSITIHEQELPLDVDIVSFER